jgi:PAS domain S-box-containing protein
MLNKLLQRQIQKHLGGIDNLPENYIALLGTISESYDHYEKDRKMLERSIDLSSNEMIELNNQLRKDILELKKTKKEMKESEANLQTIFQCAETGYVLIDKELKVIFSNQHAQRFVKEAVNSSFEEGKYIADCFPPTRQESIKNILTAVLKGNPIDYEINYYQEDDSERWYHIKYFPVSNDEGVSGVIISINDFTERKLIEQQIKQNNDLLSEAQQLAKVGNWNVDLTKNEIFWSSGTRTTYGVDEDFKPSFESFISMIHPEDRDRVVAKIMNAQHNGTSVEDEFRIVRKDGQVRVLNGQTRFVMDDEGKPSRIFGISQDITELKLAEETLRRSEANLRSIFDNTKTSYILLDSECRILSFNPVADLWAKNSLTTPLLEGNFWWDYFPQKLHKNLKEKGGSILRGNTIQEEVRFLHTDGSMHYYEAIASPVGYNEEKVLGICIAFNDITERKLAELERERMTLDITQRNKNLEQFSYIVSHNLRAPVANIIGISSAIQDTESDDLKNTLLEGLYISSMKLDEVIMDLTNILQIKHEIKERKEAVSFSQLSNDIYMSIQTQLETSNATVKWDFSEIDMMLTLKSYMQSIFYNLIFNSVKYRQPTIAPVIEIRSRKLKNNIELIFSDNCMGIDLQKNGAQIFGLYKRFHNNQTEGKGLGLFMVKTQVEAIGGKISVQSEVNKGTEFKIEFEL